MRKLNVVAGIVTFNPDLTRLRENIESAMGQVDRMVIVDNGSSNMDAVSQLAAGFPRLEIIANRGNDGIAMALNRIMGWASAVGAGWALLLDQDSVCADGMVGILRGSASEGVAVVAPGIVDRNRPETTPQTVGPAEVDYCITSGAIYSVAAWKSVGGYDEEMFIDFVDFDYCLRLKTSGHRIVRDPLAILLHEIGHITKHGPFTAYHHSAFRLGHMSRDMLYYAKKHKRSPRELMVQRRRLAGTYAVLARKAVVVTLFEKDRARKVASIARGTLAGTRL